MRIEYSAFILPHIGDKFSQCADRFSCGETNQCFAIADGVGNSLFPGDWAQLLCDDFIEHPTLFSDNTHLQREDELISNWEEQRDKRIANLSDEEKFIYEMGLDKADFAASTFVGLLFDKKHWSCQAIGDSYLFLVDQDYNISRRVASMDGHDFDNFPEYFASKKGQNNGTVVNCSGDYKDVAYFALMTDALSDWFIEATPAKRKELLNIHSHSEYEAFIDKERQMMALKDDDTTMLILKVEDDRSENLSIHSNPDRLDNIDSLIQDEKETIDKEGTNQVEIDDDTPPSPDNNIEETISPKHSECERNTRAQSIDIEIRRIKRDYNSYNMLQLKNCIKKLVKIIEKLLSYGTSD